VDCTGKDSSTARSFVLDISSVGGVLLYTVPGTPHIMDGKIKYSFAFHVPATFDGVGTKIISFRYVPYNKKDIPLSNYDDTYGELIEDPLLLNYTVNAELHMVNIEEKPKDTDFFYGNTITYRFRARDSVSNRYVTAGQNGNIFLSLKHQQPGRSRTFISTNQPATHYVDAKGNAEGFLIRWSINPNAVRGPATLSIAGQDADGNTIPFYREGKKEEVQFMVSIGGDITVQSNVYTALVSEASETAFVVGFNLFCQDRALLDAQLKCAVSYGSDQTSSQELFQVPVAVNEKGYEVSWTSPHEKVLPGQYRLSFYREVDRVRGDSEKKKEGEAEEPLKPLFELNHTVQPISTTRFPFSTEFLAVITLGASFSFIWYRKSKY